MRTLPRLARVALTAGLLAVTVTACSTPVRPVQSTPGAAATTVKATPTPTVSVPTADRAVANDLHIMSIMQDNYIKAHPTKHGRAVTTTKPGQSATLTRPHDYPTLPGNVITVKVTATGYCISVYNKDALKANKPANAMLYKSDADGIQDDLGTC